MERIIVQDSNKLYEKFKREKDKLQSLLDCNAPTSKLQEQKEIVEQVKSEYDQNLKNYKKLIDSVHTAQATQFNSNNVYDKVAFSRQLKTAMSATISNDILKPIRTSSIIEERFNEISGILDLVNTITFNGGYGYTVPYVKNTSIGGITAETEEYTETPTEFGTIDINAIKITGFSEYSEEVERLPDAEFANYIENEVLKAIRRKIIQEIIKGTGTMHFSGLYDTKLVDPITDISIKKIDDKTLNTIVYSHNSEAEEMENGKVLFLNKKDLGKFAELRNPTGDPTYQIKINHNGMTGFINGTKFCICNALDDFTSATTNSYTMAYLDPKKYTLAIFSNIEFLRDYSAGFKNGMISVKGSIICGGSMTSPYALARIKKVA